MCPQCGSRVPQGASICPKCDFIIDDSFAQDAFAHDEPDTDHGVERTQLKHVEEIAAPPTRAAPRRSIAAAPPMEDPGTLDDEPGAFEEPRSSSIVSPDDAFRELKFFVRDLSTGDKLAFFGFAGTLLFCLFPWKDTAKHGEVLGITSLGAATFLASALALAAMTVRVRRTLPSLGAFLPWVAQLGAAIFSLFWCLVFIKLAWDGTLVRSAIGNIEVAVSKPALGAYLGLMSSALAVGGSVLTMRGRG